MNFLSNTLSDGRVIGCTAFEVESFPQMDAFGEDHEKNIVQIRDLFIKILNDFYKLSQTSYSAAELLWVSEKTELQTFVSKIRFFFVFRRIGSSKDLIAADLEQISNNMIISLSAKQYGIDSREETLQDLLSLLKGKVGNRQISVVKTERQSGNMSSPYPYYFTDVVSMKNTDNFDSLISTMSSMENCVLSFQILPTQFTTLEQQYLNEYATELSRLADGVITHQQVFKDISAAEPMKVMSYYLQNIKSPLFLYNLVISGNKANCEILQSKVINLLQTGESKIVKSDFGFIDLSDIELNISGQFLLYPWNINNKLVHTYRNQKLLQILPMAKTLYRLPYIMTVEEVSSFYRLPLRDRSMAALKENQNSIPYDQYDESVLSEKNLILGSLLLNNRKTVVIGCPESIFTKHALVVGTPGSGKTTFSLNILSQFAKRGIPFLAIEPTKTEYRSLIDVLPELQVFTPGNNTVSPYIVNPFLPPSGVQIEQFIPSLASAFKAAFSMPAPLDIIFLRAIRTAYIENGWKDYSKYGDSDVTIFGLHEFIVIFKRIVNESNYANEIKGNLQSAGVFRLLNLIEQNSNIFDTIHNVPIEEMLTIPTVLELNSIGNSEQKALLIALLLINIFLFTKHNRIQDGQLKNILLIDEAHVLLGSTGSTNSDSADPQGTMIKAIQDMIAEIRSYGTGIIIADQSPTKVSREVVANTDIKVAFRLVETADRTIIAESTNMDELARNKLARLKPGEAYVYFSKLDTPQLIVTENIRESIKLRSSVSNKELAERMIYWRSRKAALKPFYECGFIETCKEECDFSLRSKAHYYANKLFNKYANEIIDKGIMKRFVVSVENLLIHDLKDFEDSYKKRLISCIKIRFIRKIQIEKSITISRREIQQVLLQGGSQND